MFYLPRLFVYKYGRAEMETAGIELARRAAQNNQQLNHITTQFTNETIIRKSTLPLSMDNMKHSSDKSTSICNQSAHTMSCVRYANYFQQHTQRKTQPKTTVRK